MPYTTLVAGTVITASWANASVRDQVVTPFASTAARTSAITAAVEGMVTYQTDTDKLEIYNGTTWEVGVHLGAWTTWVPTLTNLTQGNGTVTAKYQQVGKAVRYRFKFKLGSTSAVGTSPKFTLPVAPNAEYVADEDRIGVVTLLDPSVNLYDGYPRFSGGSTVEISALNASGANVTVTPISATVPHTWGTADSMTAYGTYDVA